MANLEGRHFTEKELKEKAGRWALEIRRNGKGKHKKSDTLPTDLEEVRTLAGKLFTPADAAVFNAALEKALAPPSGE